MFESTLGQPTTTAATAAFVRAVGQFLLGQVEREAGFYLVSRLDGRGGGERPARPAEESLILFWRDHALGGEVLLLRADEAEDEREERSCVDLVSAPELDGRGVRVQRRLRVAAISAGQQGRLPNKAVAASPRSLRFSSMVSMESGLRPFT